MLRGRATLKWLALVPLHGCHWCACPCACALLRRLSFLTTGCCNVQFAANDSNRSQVIAEYRAALDPVRAILKEYPWLGGAEGPSYTDIYLMAFFMVRCSSLHCSTL